MLDLGATWCLQNLGVSLKFTNMYVKSKVKDILNTGKTSFAPIICMFQINNLKD